MSVYYCFTKSHDLDAALKRFAEKFSMPAKRYFYYANMLWVGPTDEEDEDEDEFDGAGVS